MQPIKKDVLVIDDDSPIRHMLAAAMTRLGLSCDTATDGADALEQIRSTTYIVVLVDFMMPRVDGEQFVIALREHEAISHERPVVMMMTAFPPRERLPIIGEKVQALIQKPFDLAELAELVRGCVEARKLIDARRTDRPIHDAVGLRDAQRPRRVDES